MLTTGKNGEYLDGTLTNEANVNFDVPEGQSRYLTAGNDVVDLSKWNGSGSVNIGDAFSSDNDKVTVMAGALQKNNLKLTSIENLEIVNSNVKTSVALNGANFKGLEAIKLIGDDTTLDVSSFTQGVKIDATAKADYIFGSNKADTINGGAGNDTIIGNDGDDVLTGGNGADTFIVGNAKDFGVDQILDFSAEDKISMVKANLTFTAQVLKKFDASTFSTVTYKTLDSVLATFRQDGANQTGTGDVVIFSYDGKTYALLADGAFDEARDALVDITGANVASLNESNFGATSTTPPMPPIPQGTTYRDYTEFVNAVASGTIPAGEQVSIETLTGQEAGLLAVNKTYLDKIAAGGIKNVNGDIVVAVGATSGVSDNFNSTEFANKLAADALGSNVMIINGSTVGDVIVTTLGGTINGGAGNDRIYVSGSGAANIKGEEGDDIIDASAATGTVSINSGVGNDVITGGAGDDRITTTGTGKNTITAGSGNDTITLSTETGATDTDTIIFEATAIANGVDTIHNFTVSTNRDKLDVSAFLNASAAVGTGSSDAQLDASGKNVIVLNSTAAGGSSNVTNLTAGGNYIVVIGGNSDSKVYYYTNGSDASMALSALASAVTDNVATLVGVNDTSVVNLNSDNFVGQ